MTEPIDQKILLNQLLQDGDLEQSVLPQATSQPYHPNGSTSTSDDTSAASEPVRPVQSSPNMGRNLGQIMIILVVLLVLVNIPFNNYSAGLAQLMPQSSSVVIRNGMRLKGSGPEIYILDDYKLRQISSPEAMAAYFGHTRNVSTVEDSMLEQFGQGPPIHRLVQCRTESPIYALENGHKRWVKEPPVNRVKPWDSVHFVSCSYLRGLPAGPPISEDVAGWTSVY